MSISTKFSKPISLEMFSKSLFVFLILFFFLYFFNLGNIGLIDVDEPRYAEAAREMIESENYIVPYFNYEVRYDKPVFFYWLEVLSMKIFGINEFAARIPSTISAFLCLGMVYVLLSTFFPSTMALLGTLILMSTLIFSVLARFSTPDMALTCYISSAIISFFLGYYEVVSSGKFFKTQIGTFSYWYLSGFVFLAFGMLTKGPVAPLVVFMILFPFFWWIRRLEYFYKNTSFWIGVILFFIISLPWYLVVHQATGGEFTKVFFGLHNFSRYTSVVSGHDAPVYYFIPVLLIGFLPWIFFLPQAIFNTISHELTNKINTINTQLQWLSLWWFVFVFCFFSISKTKLLTYILPCFPALAILISIWIWNVLKKEENKGFTSGFLAFFILNIGLFFLCIFNFDTLLPRELRGMKMDILILIFVFVLFVGVSMALASSNKDIKFSLITLFSTMIIEYFFLLFIFLPRVDTYALLPSRKFVKSLPEDTVIVLYHSVKPSITFYARKKIKNLRKKEKVNEYILGEKKFAFITKKDKVKDLNLENVYKLGEDSRNVFYSNFRLY